MPCLKSQRTGRACLCQLYRVECTASPRFPESRALLHDNHVWLGNRGCQGTGRKILLELEPGVSACSIIGPLSEGPGEITALL